MSQFIPSNNYVEGELSASSYVGDGSSLGGLARDYGCRATDPPSEPPSYTEDFESTTVGSLPAGWTSFGDATWIVSASNPHAGTKCAISQDIGDNQSTSLVYTASLATPALVTFWWDVSSESGWDYLKFYVDGVEKDSISGTPGYAQYSTSLPAGTSSLRWEYVKDGSTSTGLDQGYVDDFQITPILWECGDLYYNSVLDMTMQYDINRLKWLSVETAELHFGAAGTTPPGSGFSGSSGLGFTSIVGRYAEHSGTVVSMTYAKTDLANTTFLVTADGSTAISTVPSFVEFRSSSLDLNDDFSANTVLGVANSPIAPSASVDNIMGTVRIKWRI